MKQSLVKRARSKHKLPRVQWIVVVTRGTKSRFFYGETRRDAIAAAHIKPHEVFTACKYTGGTRTVCALTEKNTVLEY